MDASYQLLFEQWRQVACNILKPLSVAKDHSGPVNVVIATEEHYFSAGDDYMIYQYKTSTGLKIGTFQKHLAPISLLKIQNDVLISADVNGLIVAWDINKKTSIAQFQGHQGPITALCFDQSQRLFSGGMDKTIREWDLKTGKEISNFEGHLGKINQIIYSSIKAPMLFTCADDDKAISWDLTKKKKSIEFSGHSDSVLCIFLDENTKTLFTGSADKSINAWDIKNGKLIRKFVGHSGPITHISVLKNYLYTCSEDNTIGIIRVKGSKKDSFVFLEGHQGKIYDMIVLHDRILTSSQDDTIRLWSIKTQSCQALYEGHLKAVTSMSITESGTLISGGKDSLVIRWPKVKLKTSSRSGSLIEESKEQKQQQTETNQQNQDILSTKIQSDNVTIWVNGKQYSVPSNLNIVEACRVIGVEIYSLCYHPRLHPLSTCKCCVVEIESSLNNSRKACACATQVREGMKIFTNTVSVKDQQRQAILELRMKQRSRVLRAKEEKFDHSTEFGKLLDRIVDTFIDNSNYAISVDLSKCIDCARCAQVCDRIQGMSVISFPARSIGAIETVFRTRGKFLSETQCIACGQCSVFCPTGAISAYDNTGDVLTQLKAKKKKLVVGIAPSVRVTISEEFDREPGTISAGKFVAALRLLGFEYVFDVQFFADLTIMEEGTELLQRLSDPNAVLPMFTSCCPAWINMVEKLYPELIPHISSAKSPQQMFGAIVKSFFAQKIETEPKDIYCVTIMPCTGKKQELRREQMIVNGVWDVDVSLTVREIARMFRDINIDWDSLEESDFDDPLGKSSGSGSLFAATGGVMEAALRTAYELQTGKVFQRLVFQDLRGLENTKKADVDFGERKLRVVVVNSGAAIHKLIHQFKKGEISFDFCEMMACPGGCIGGGGQPRSNINILPKRIQAVYNNEFALPFRKSHNNEKINELYEEFLQKPKSPLSEKLLHTHYTANQRHIEIQAAKTTDMFRFAMEGLNENNSVLVLFGSQTGTAEMAAIRITQSLLQFKIKARLLEMNSFNVSKLSSEKLVVLVTSTFWEGSFPENAIHFWEDLQRLTTRLKSLRYSIFGLGNSTYTHFNHAGRLLESQMKKLGAKEITEFGAGDYEDPDGYLTKLQPWIDGLKKAVARYATRAMKF
ncbi:iron hydrogenase [Anaeramoeba ignava]|uniref:Iron hydrogenase n=1 Tax=Anaeramoeba ignava TaxID=1746090 RepID=A0A9Q0LPE6_ANAIG|nr:iron hydrogenase [Anaeramoeba ignava]